MGGRPEIRVAKEEEEVGLVLVCWFFLLLQQGGFGGGIVAVMVGMMVVFASWPEELAESCLLSFSVNTSLVGGREFRTQQHGPRDLSHWHPVFLAVSDDSVKASSQVTKILISTSMPEARS